MMRSSLFIRLRGSRDVLLVLTWFRTDPGDLLILLVHNASPSNISGNQTLLKTPPEEPRENYTHNWPEENMLKMWCSSKFSAWVSEVEGESSAPPDEEPSYLMGFKHIPECTAPL